jgi:hypothetical protein
MLPEKRINFHSREQAFSCRGAAQFNPAHALDAAMSASLHIGHHWRGASDVRRSAFPNLEFRT